LEGKVFPLVNAAIIGKTECGIPFGTASGITMMNASEKLIDSLAFPPVVLSIKNQEAQDYIMMRFGLEQDVRIIMGNNVARIEKLTKVAKLYFNEICNDIKDGTISDKFDIENSIRNRLLPLLKKNPQKADFLYKLFEENKFIPAYYWPNFSMVVTWLSGSIGNYIPNIRKMFSENTVFFDYGYGASEGKFNIPYKPETMSGILALHGAFYEFIPYGKGENAVPVLASQVEKGEYYELVVTTYSGLYRYRMKDIVKVEGFYKNTPEIVFVSKTGDVGDIAGERLPGSLISDRVSKVFSSHGIYLTYLCGVTVVSPPHYMFCVEPDEKSFNKALSLDLNKIEKQLDNVLKKEIGYNIMRRDNLLLMPKIRLMRKGWYDCLLREKAKKNTGLASVKLPVVYKETVPFSDFIL
jgi:hypothetical protein